MSGPARRLAQPGPVRRERWLSAEGTARTLAFTLAPGLTLVDAVARPLRAAGIRAGTVELEGGALGPFSYVQPALSSDPRHAAFYSATVSPPGRTALERAVATFGERDGAPFVHCHGAWVEQGGARRAGHLLPPDTLVREPVRAEAHGTADAAFAVLPDPETNFSLLTPVRHDPAETTGARVVLLKVQPNEPLDAAIAAACRAHALRDARILGIGSLVGASFADGRVAASVATELFVRSGRVTPGPDGETAVALDIALVDVDGVIHEGSLASGNAVCITCELCLVETGRDPPTTSLEDAR